LLLSLRRNFALARPSPIELTLNVSFADFDLRRTAVDHHANSAAVRFAEGGDSKKLAKGAAH